MWPAFTTNFELLANAFGKRHGGLLSDATEQPVLTDFSSFLTTHFQELKLYMDSVGNGGTP
jgi:hypothetical protein